MKNTLIERPLMGGIIRQRVDNEMLCLTDLAKLYETTRIVNGWVEKQVSKFFENKEEIEYITELLDLQGVLTNSNKLLFTEQSENQGAVKTLKAFNQYSTKGRGDNKATYCNPYIFIAVAQWLNPRFRAYVTIWVTDQLILNRIEAGENYNTLCLAISNHIVPTLSDNGKRFIYSNMAKLINVKVFGEHKNNLRQIASKEQLVKLRNLETKLSTLIEVGYVSSYQDAKAYINNL